MGALMGNRANFLFVAVVLGLGWAMRGHFGHEWGASWAGAMGALAVVVASGKKEWALRAPVLAALGAVGWGAGGMMSYGLVVGYCRSLSFVNSLYGYAMLTVIGGLYGFIGGGLLGLGLETSVEKRPAWPGLITEMVVGGLLTWGFLIYQMEWLMTPPRSELWAGCLGAAIVLAWFLHRNGFRRAIRMAAWSALGAGVGFSLGNFIQVVGNSLEIPYNWWNVMEFTLGFFGGLGMIYAVFTRQWPRSVKPSVTGNRIALLFLFLFIPAANYFNGFATQEHETWQLLVAGISIPLFALPVFLIWEHQASDAPKLARSGVPLLLLLTTLQYNLFAWIKLETVTRSFSFSHSDSLYPFIILLLILLWYTQIRTRPDFHGREGTQESWKRWGILILLLMLLLLFITTISIHIHPEIPGAHDRF